MVYGQFVSHKSFKFILMSFLLFFFLRFRHLPDVCDSVCCYNLVDKDYAKGGEGRPKGERKPSAVLNLLGKSGCTVNGDALLPLHLLLRCPRTSICYSDVDWVDGMCVTRTRWFAFLPYPDYCLCPMYQSIKKSLSPMLDNFWWKRFSPMVNTQWQTCCSLKGSSKTVSRTWTSPTATYLKCCQAKQRSFVLPFVKMSVYSAADSCV